MNTTTPNRTQARRGRFFAFAAILALLTTMQISPAAYAHGDKTVAAGTALRVRVETAIRSTSVQPGDPFRARVVTPVTVTGEDAIPAGTMLTGRVLAVQAARSWGQPSGVTLQIDTLRSEGGLTLQVVGDLNDLNGNPLTTMDNMTVGSEVLFRLSRSLVVPEPFYMTEDGGPGVPTGGQGDDFFDSQATVQQAQTVLRDLGYYSGPMDGRLTQATRAAIGIFQRDQRLRQTGFLDRETIDRLGLVGEGNQEVSLVNAISADAATHGADSLHVRITAQTASAGWQVFEDHFRQRDTVHIYVRGIRPRNPVAQAVTQNNLNVVLTGAEAQGVNRIVVHSSGRDIVILANQFNQPSAGAPLTSQEAIALEQQITRTLSEYARTLGIRYIPLTNQVIMTRANYRENEIELLFALNSLAATSRLYSQILKSTDDPQAVKGATDIYIAQANMVDNALERTRSGRAAGVARNWTQIQPAFERLDDASSGDFNRDGSDYRP